MRTKDAEKIIEFMEYLKAERGSRLFEISVQETTSLGTIINVYNSNKVYRHEVNALMSVIDNLTSVVAEQSIDNKGRYIWRLW